MEAVPQRDPATTNATAGPGELLPARRTGVSRLMLALGIVFLAVSTSASVLLAVDHIHHVALPGCGVGGACQQAFESLFGAIRIGTRDGLGTPKFEWPVAYLGVAYFAALLVIWIVARGDLPPLLEWVVRLGVLGSLGFTLIIVVKWMFCPYCIAAHVGNFAFWITMELTRRKGPARRKGHLLTPASGLFIVVFAVVNVGLGVWQSRVYADSMAKAEQELSQSQEEIIRRSHRPVAEHPGVLEQVPSSQGAWKPSATESIGEREAPEGVWQPSPEDLEPTSKGAGSSEDGREPR
jgi:hypothetical protein